MDKKRLETYMDESKRVLNNAVGFAHHTLAIAAGMAALRIRWLETALEYAISIIQQWHDIGMGEQAAGNGGSEAWKIYRERAPEMKPLLEALPKKGSELSISPDEWKRKVKSLFLDLWSNAVGTDTYDKDKWIELQNLLDRVMR